MMVSNPVQSTTTKRRFRQRMVLPGVKLTQTAITYSLVLEKRSFTAHVPAAYEGVFSVWQVQSHLIRNLTANSGAIGPVIPV
jgi:hypothetical protein